MSNLVSILKNVGSAVFAESVPGGAHILKAVNHWLADEDKLPVDASGDSVADAVAKLPPDRQVDIYAQYMQLQSAKLRESHSTVRAMLTEDAKNPHSTRPRIAYQCFQVMAAISLMFTASACWSLVTGNTESLAQLVEMWAFALAVITPFAVVVHAYFGVLRDEHKTKLNAAGGFNNPVSGIMSLFRR